MRAKKPSKTSRKRTKKKGRPFPVVGIGASAGGLGPLQSFFRAVRVGSDSAFVVIQHLHPDHPSLTAELLGKCTSLPVTEATDSTQLEPNHVYTIPPNRIPAIRNGAIRLTRPVDRSASRTPIDDLFRSLAADREERAVGIVLSGSGTDGTEGVRALHAAGGLVIVQDPKTAQFDSMPQSAIAAGDFGIVLPVEKMPDAVRRYARHPYMRHAPKALSTTEEGDLDAVLSLVQERLGLQLTEYKNGPLARRIHRRMGLQHVERLDDYAALLAGDKAEMAALGRDLLITVSEFFRDAPAWEALGREVVAPLVAAKAPDEPIRVWVAGTATGEEAYSLAIVLFEKIDAAKKRCPLQVFATDVSQTALGVARNGAYAAGIATCVAPSRLRRFFETTLADHGYRVSQRLRSVVTFAPHDLLRDPPFLNLDLVSCRNLLIYLEPKTQEKLLAMFHFALRPNGYLFLGSAESEGTCRDLFAPISKKWRIYRRIGTGKGHPVTFSTARRGQPPQPVSRPASGVGGAITTEVVQRAILDRVAPPSAVVDRRGEVLYLWGDVDRYLALPRGVPTRDILSMIRPAFRARLRRALQHAARHASTVTVEAVPIEGDGASGRIRVRVHPLTGESETEGCLLVTFGEAEAAPAVPVRRRGAYSRDSVVRDLEKELKATQRELERARAHLDSSEEQSRAANEELLSVNEEFRTTNEELQTSKEELQSANEELLTVNSEIQRKVEELERANDDLENLLASTEVATVCLDRQSRIKWFTSGTNGLVNLIPADIGRPITDIASKFLHEDLVSDAAVVLEKLAMVEKEVQTLDGRWYSRRTHPYRSAERGIEGVVITLTDIDLRKRAEMTLRDLNEDLERRIAERTRHLRLLHEVATITNEAQSAEEGIRRLIERVCREPGWLLGHAWLLESEEGTVFVDSGLWSPPSASTEFAPFVEARRVMRIGEGPGFVEAAIAKRSPQWISDVSASSALGRPVESLSRHGIRGALAVPILIGKSVVGVLEFFTADAAEPERVVSAGLAEFGEQIGRVIERERAVRTLRQVSSELLAVEERERQQLAADLHDEVGQLLPLARIRLDTVAAEAPPALAKGLAELGRILDRATEATRTATFQLSPPPLRDLGLVPAVHWLAEDTAKHHGLKVLVEGDAGVSLSEPLRLLLFRSVRELLMNVSRHAQASEARVRFARGDHELSIVVSDNGVGFAPPAAGMPPPRNGRFGLFSIRERLSYIGGRLEIRSAPGSGATVTVTVPLEPKGIE